MNFEWHIKKVVQFFFFQLRNIARIKAMLSFRDLEKIIHVLVSSRLDYCNSLFTTLSSSSVSRLQLVQNAAARLLTNTGRRSHITPVLADLHWLPTECINDFNFACFVSTLSVMCDCLCSFYCFY